MFIKLTKFITEELESPFIETIFYDGKMTSHCIKYQFGKSAKNLPLVKNKFKESELINWAKNNGYKVLATEY